MMTSDEEVIQRILNQTRSIAVVGLSSDPARPGYYVPAYLQEQGYRIIPVNPNLERALGEQAYPNLAAVPDKVDLVQIFRRPEHIPPIVDEAIRIGAQAVWMQLGLIHPGAAQKALAAGLDVVMDACMLVEHRRLKAAGKLGT